MQTLTLFAFGLRRAYESVTGRGSYGCRHTLSGEANDYGPVVDAVDDGCTGSVRIINRPLELPIGPNESMDHTCRIGVRADHLSLVIQTEGLRSRRSWKVECCEDPLIEQETVRMS